MAGVLADVAEVAEVAVAVDRELLVVVIAETLAEVAVAVDRELLVVVMGGRLMMVLVVVVGVLVVVLDVPLQPFAPQFDPGGQTLQGEPRVQWPVVMTAELSLQQTAPCS
jgi:hypothetical protein